MNGFKKYFKNRINEVIALLQRPKRKYRPDTFHQLRVGIKKLDALFELIKFCAEDFNRNKFFKPLEEIFQQAGKVRDLQIERSLMKRHFFLNSLKSYTRDLIKQQQQAKKDFFSVKDKSLISKIKKSHAEVAPFLKAISRNKVKRFLDEKRNEIKELLTNLDLQHEQGHELRKILKTYYYVVTNPNLKGKFKNSSKDKLSPVLGKWHDYDMMLTHLEKVIKANQDTPKNAKRFEKIKNRITVKGNLWLAKANKIGPSTEFLKSS